MKTMSVKSSQVPGLSVPVVREGNVFRADCAQVQIDGRGSRAAVEGEGDRPVRRAVAGFIFGFGIVAFWLIAFGLGALWLNAFWLIQYVGRVHHHGGGLVVFIFQRDCAD